jgi:DNA mismatch endonuclease, patch repair protein
MQEQNAKQSAKQRRRYRSSPVGLSPPSTSKAVSASMKSNKASGTKPELVLAQLLRKRIMSNNLPGRPDFVYQKAKVVVFVHGCWWHRCPRENFALPRSHTAFWRRKFARNVERDRLNREESESMGWKVIEIWEHEVKANPRSCTERILAEVRARGRIPALDRVRRVGATA